MHMDFSKLYCIVDRATCENMNVKPEDIARFFIERKVPFLQYRDKSLGDKCDILQSHKIAWQLRQLAWETDTKFILNDNLQSALDLDADGVHLGQEDLQELINEVERDYGIKAANFYFNALREHEMMQNRLYKNFIFGVSTHTVDQAVRAEKMGADYIGVGPIFETPTKPGIKGIGLDEATAITRSVRIPTVGIGGIVPDMMSKIIQSTGVTYTAMVRGCVEIYLKNIY